MIKFYNTLTRTIQNFVPINKKIVKLYSCGLTVYSQPHIGNWVIYTYWDILVRTLRQSGYQVIHVQNITDVGHLTSDEDSGQDKMLKGVKTEGMTAWGVADKYIEIADREAYSLLGLTRPTHMPRATDYINQQIDFVKQLESLGYTYKIDDGVYYDSSKFPTYGELAKLDISGLRAGARVANNDKKHPTDFALWKFSSPGEKRDMEWDSPWGKGFPGWHLECSVMAREILGDEIDIHTGGIDHIPVHHTNEIAQTEAITKTKFSNFWLHGNHLKVNSEKISKSLGNSITLEDIISKGYSLEAYKITILSKHYRTEGNFTWDIIEASQNRISKLNQTLDESLLQPNPDSPILDDDYFASSAAEILTHLQNDLDTPGALNYFSSVLDNLELNDGVHPSQTKLLLQFLKAVDAMLGLNFSNRKDINNDQKDLVRLRQEARQDKDWDRSDEIRDKLLESGIRIRDKKTRQVWHRVS